MPVGVRLPTEADCLFDGAGDENRLRVPAQVTDARDGVPACLIRNGAGDIIPPSDPDPSI
jgi:hypothetical protein